jgi:hypothetical protein
MLLLLGRQLFFINGSEMHKLNIFTELNWHKYKILQHIDKWLFDMLVKL